MQVDGLMVPQLFSFFSPYSLNRPLFLCSFTDRVLCPCKRPLCELEGAPCAPYPPITRRRVHPTPSRREPEWEGILDVIP